MLGDLEECGLQLLMKLTMSADFVQRGQIAVFICATNVEQLSPRSSGTWAASEERVLGAGDGRLGHVNGLSGPHVNLCSDLNEFAK